MALRSPRYYDDDEQVTEEDLNAIRKTMVWDEEPVPPTYKKATSTLVRTSFSLLYRCASTSVERSCSQHVDV